MEKRRTAGVDKTAEIEDSVCVGGECCAVIELICVKAMLLVQTDWTSST